MNILSKYYDWYNQCYGNNNMYIIALVIFYDNRTNNANKVYRLLSCVLYSVIESYILNGYLCCQSKTVSEISSDKLFKILVTMNCLVL